MFEFSGFVMRNKMYSLKNWRRLSKVRSAMRAHKKANPQCAFCGTTKTIQTHHVVPISVDPKLAWDIGNMISLSRKPACHHVLGHGGSWGGRYTKNIREICGKSKIVKINDISNG